jgi:ClpP class serine protease
MTSSNATDEQTVIVTSGVAFVTFKASKRGASVHDFPDVYMMLSETQSPFGPWVLLPDRLPFVRATLRGVSECRRQTLPQTLTKATANAVRRQASNSAVAVLPFYGVAVQGTGAMGEALGLLSLWHFTKAFRAALADDSVSTPVIDVDSPGGSMFGVMELAARFTGHAPSSQSSQSRTGSPPAARIGSGAVQASSTSLLAAKSAALVSMTCISICRRAREGPVKTSLISAGCHKVEGNPFQPLSASWRSAMQARVDGYYREFVAAVAKHRSVPESEVLRGMGAGRLLGAERAKHENMVDGIASFDEVVRKLAQHIGQGKMVNAFARCRRWAAGK